MGAIGNLQRERRGALAQHVASLDVAPARRRKDRLDAAGAPPMLDAHFIFDLPRDRIFGGQSRAALG